jgi:uncharacterized membrane protein YfcA
VSAGELALLAAAAFAAGAVNAGCGGGSLISFPALVAVGVPTLAANVTNQIAVLPGYLGGTVAYRAELEGQRRRLVALVATSSVGALVGALLLVISSQRLFEVVAPVLVLAAVGLLAAQPRLSQMEAARAAHPCEREHPTGRLHVENFLASVYGGYFGAGLGITLLAILAIGLEDSLQRLNALKGLLSLVVAVVAAVFFALFGPVHWDAAAVMAVASFTGGHLGVGVARRISDEALRYGVIAIGTAVAIWLFTRI